MKKILAIVFVMTMVFGMTACQKKGELSNDVMTLSQYKGLEIEVYELTVTDADVERSIHDTMDAEEMGEVKDITDEAAQNEDTVVIDYVGTMDGEVFEGGSAEDVELTIGSSNYIDGFDTGIIGHKPGETFDVNIKFPDPYTNNPDYSGKDVTFTMTLHSIKRTIYPELTDAIATELNGEEITVADYQAKVRADLETSNKVSMESQQRGAIWQALINNCTVEAYPEDVLQAKKEEIEQTYSPEASMNNVDVDTYVKYAYNTTVDDMAKELLKQQYAIELIVKKEKITLSEEEYQEGLKKYANASAAYAGNTEELTEEEIKTFEETVTREEVEEVLIQDKVVDFLLANCKKITVE